MVRGTAGVQDGSAGDREDKFRTLSDGAQDAVIVMDHHGRVTEWNPAAERIFGYPADEAIGRDVHRMLAPAREQEATAQGLAAFGEHGSGPMVGMVRELTGIRRDGLEFPVELSVSSVQLRGTWHAIGIVRDVTERKRAEAALHRANRELRAIHACNQVLVRAQDEQGLLQDICRTICHEAGYRMAWVGLAEDDPARTVRPVAWAGVEDGYLQGITISWADTEHGRGPTGIAIRTQAAVYAQDYATDPRLAPWRQQALTRGYRSSIALPLLGEDGTPLGALTLYAADPDAFTPEEIRLLEQLANDLAFGMLALRARAEQRRAESTIRRLNAELEQRVAERTADLETVNRELEAFAYSVSHDLRSPLRAVAGFSGLLERRYRDTLDDDGRRLLHNVVEGAQQMAGLIDGLLALSRVGRAELRSEPVDMDAVVRSVVAEALAGGPDRPVAIEVAPLPEVTGDPAVLRQVWANLIGNALKFTRSRTDPRVTISARTDLQEVAFEVRDNGIGFDAAYAERLFGVFQRLPTTDEYEGHGIGLAIVARIIARHGGRVWASSEPGAGATFGFSLPR